jgi:hypothetical protein
MDKKEAKSILSEYLSGYLSRSYAELAALVLAGQSQTRVVLPSGSRYQLEVQFFWDDEPDGDVRVLGSVDDGGIRAFIPITDDFILSPDGRFVGE